jgi:hypothetical protein
MIWETALGGFLGAVIGVGVIRLLDRAFVAWLHRHGSAPGLPIAGRQAAAKAREPLPGNEVSPVLGSTKFMQSVRAPRRSGHGNRR